jgi:hypothetical protein
LNQVGRASEPKRSAGSVSLTPSPPSATPLSFRLDHLGLISTQCVLDRLQHRPQPLPDDAIRIVARCVDKEDKAAA